MPCRRMHLNKLQAMNRGREYYKIYNISKGGFIYESRFHSRFDKLNFERTINQKFTK